MILGADQKERGLWGRECRGDITDSESDDNMNIRTILEVPSSDERSPAYSMGKKKHQENSLGESNLDVLNVRKRARDHGLDDRLQLEDIRGTR